MNKDLKIAKKTVETEIIALKKLSSTFNKTSQFSKAVNLLSKMKGKCLVVGVGKSYIVGLKVSSTPMGCRNNGKTSSNQTCRFF